MPNRYYSLLVDEKENEAHIYIYGDILEDSWLYSDSDVTPCDLVQALKDLDVANIIVHINSYGGHVSAGLAIYNSLKNHEAEITTICDGFACSAASSVFMAGDKRIMNSASLLMIHNAWIFALGDHHELRKKADDLEKITEVSANAYRDAGVTLSDEELKEMLDTETWITPEKALEWGFATSICKPSTTSEKAAASARQSLIDLVLSGQAAKQSAQGSKPENPIHQYTSEDLAAALITLLNAQPENPVVHQHAQFPHSQSLPEQPPRQPKEPGQRAVDSTSVFLRAASIFLSR